jgi:hypothetical protein
MIKYDYLKKENFENIARDLFEILANNMDGIAPTGNPREDDYKTWHSDVSPKVEKDEVSFLLATEEETGNIVAFLEHHFTEDTLVLDEVQISKAYHGKGNVFRDIHGVVINSAPEGCVYVEAAANKLNSKSIGVLGTLGLKVAGELHNGGCVLMRGSFSDFLQWYKRK